MEEKVGNETGAVGQSFEKNKFAVVRGEEITRFQIFGTEKRYEVNYGFVAGLLDKFHAEQKEAAEKKEREFEDLKVRMNSIERQFHRLLKISEEEKIYPGRLMKEVLRGSSEEKEGQGKKKLKKVMFEDAFDSD